MNMTAKEEINGILSRMEESIPNYKRRKSQYTMIARAATLFGRARTEMPDGTTHPHIIEIDAPTGTGKTFAYIVPGLVMSRRLKKRFVVSSSTINLQQQIIKNDLPVLRDCYDENLKFVIAKGRTRYVCPSRLNREASEAGQISLLDEHGQSMSSTEAKKRDESIIKLHGLFKSGEWNGDRDSLKGVVVDDSAWRSVSTDRQGCTGNSCANIRECPFFKARSEMESADVIITNHDLLLADLSLGGGLILPEPEETVYCIDEAHTLPEKAVQSFSAFHSVKNSISLAERMVEYFSGSFVIHLDETERNTIIRHGELLHSAMNDLANMLDSISFPPNQDTIRFPFGCVPEEFYTIGTNVTTSSNMMFSSLGKVHDALLEAKDEGRASGELIDKTINDISQLSSRLESIYKVWLLMISETPEKSPPIAKWIKQSGRDVLICASPTSAAAELKSLFYDKAHAVLLTSATLSVLGKFDLFNHKSGLNFNPDTVESLMLPSPFNFKEQARLIVHDMKSDPKNAADHTAEVISLTPQYLETKNGTGGLVLFQSRKQMEDVYNAMSDEIKACILVQDTMSKESLLSTHKDRIDNRQSSYIFGLSGMSEGVDLPAHYCTLVIIAKLPFSVPTNPIESAEAEWLESIGRNPFTEVAVPSAGMKLAQSVGRLIRKETDYGVVVVFDRRLAKTNYGKMLIKSLPDFEMELLPAAA